MGRSGVRKTNPTPDLSDLADLREERLCIIEFGCRCTRAEAEKKLAKLDTEAALKGVTVDLFGKVG
jgi:hypothetical protein